MDAWFQTVDGDAGSKGDITQKFVPATEKVSSWLLAGNGALFNSPATWLLKNYEKKLLSAPPYNYLAERFLAKAKAANNMGNQCNIPSGNLVGLNYLDAIGNCSGTARLNSAPNGDPSVFFIEGDLNITGDVVLKPGDSTIFIVSRDILVESSVNRIDGIYIAGRTFDDVGSGSPTVNVTFEVNGSVLAGNVSLDRVLNAGNSTTPAEKFIFQPKYLVLLNSLLGSAAISWKEVNP
ncbi:hypothetical protein A3I56_04060 [Candidatus Roizmanbacteria bacterium RIFCSPLOWO2_02_FULL_43_10]|uniref:Uncharacterized protein n=1 Tax=Candidatus Roizmanbacteria bacterium RIFCSPLOWO2_02_FULL_43_10 TaxID=1802078 RepID=A0A1F7JV42_9BACT|nr:MAG: hypothetical protein A3I56_04060 [Candidatus Roizmanbacteria bacterium RIFCSPLOWO2_02_FULL_43_10]